MEEELAESLQELINIAKQCHKIYEPLLSERKALAKARERLSVYRQENQDKRKFSIGYVQNS